MSNRQIQEEKTSLFSYKDLIKGILALEKRISRLERGFLGGLFLGVLLGAVFCLGASPVPGSNPFVIFDDNLTQRAILGLSEGESGTPALWMYDRNKVRRLFLGLDNEDRPVLVFYDDTGAVTWSTAGLGEPDASRKGSKKATRVIWPKNELQEVYVWDTRYAKTFHQWKCPNFDWTRYNRKITIKRAREAGILPCKECCKEFWEGL